MLTLDDITSTVDPEMPRRVCVYGVEGIGKSTWAAQAPNPVFIQTEPGLGSLNCKAFPLAKDASAVFQAVELLLTGKHDFRTAVLDSIDWTEQLFWRGIASAAGKDSIADIGFGKGYKQAADTMRNLLGLLGELATQRRMMVILIGHCRIRKFNDPLTESYDQYTLDLHEDAATAVREWCDELFFANYQTFVKKTDSGQTKAAKGDRKRLLYTSKAATHDAKNRLLGGVPESIPLSFEAYLDCVAKHFEAMKTDVPF